MRGEINENDGAIYNEIEPYAAQWLRNLIESGSISAGHVLEQSIEELKPEDVARATRFHTFAGIGVWDYALALAGWPPDVPVWTGSAPCQPFSVAGRGEGAGDARHLWPAWFALIKECRPRILFGEQSAAPLGRLWFDAVSADLETLGYAVGASDVCAAGVGAPHLRQRIYFVAYADDTGLEGWGERGDGANQRAARESGLAGELGNTNSAGGRRHARAVSGEEAQGSSERGVNGDLTHEPSPPSPTSELADSEGERCKRTEATPEQTGRNGTEYSFRTGDQSAGGGFWADAEWIPCTDGKSRPIERGTLPLATRTADRVGRIRAYGNAICAPLAAEFIRSSAEVMGIELEGAS